MFMVRVKLYPLPVGNEEASNTAVSPVVGTDAPPVPLLDVDQWAVSEKLPLFPIQYRFATFHLYTSANVIVHVTRRTSLATTDFAAAN